MLYWNPYCYFLVFSFLMYATVKNNMANLKQLHKVYQNALDGLKLARSNFENECREQFDRCDKNDSGSISVGEFLNNYLNEMKDKDYETMRRILDDRMDQFKKIDEDGDGTLTFEEVLQFMYDYTDK